MTKNLTAAQFMADLETHISEAELKKYERYFPPAQRGNDQFIGVRMGDVFKLAKEYMDMPLAEVEKLLESKVHEARVGAVSILDFQARSKKTSDDRKKELFDLYIRRHDRIDTWDLVDRSGFWVVGTYLVQHPEKMSILEKLAKSKQMSERRTAMIATGQIAMQAHDTGELFKIAATLLHDKDPYINKAVGWMLRVGGEVTRPELLAFLDKYAADMPRETLRYAVEKLDKTQKDHYMKLV